MLTTTKTPFQIVCDYKPVGDQPAAIEKICNLLADKKQKYACLLGATGTGKTFTMANVIERLQKPALILSHNKTLAAQLYEEMRELFPNNIVIISSVITTTTNPKHTSPSAISTSKKTPHAMMISTASVSPQHQTS